MVGGDELTLPAQAQARLELVRAKTDLAFRRFRAKLDDQATNAFAEIEDELAWMAYRRFFAFAQEAVRVDRPVAVIRQAIERHLDKLIDEVFLREHPARYAPLAHLPLEEPPLHRFRRLTANYIKGGREWRRLQRFLFDLAAWEAGEETPAEGEHSGEVSRRLRLVEEYKAATGLSEYAIVRAAGREHSCHKPEFRKWKRGELPAESETAKSLERFLRAKRPPRETPSRGEKKRSPRGENIAPKRA